MKRRWHWPVIKFVKEDCWIGVYWKTNHWRTITTVYICIIPCFPIVLEKS